MRKSACCTCRPKNGQNARHRSMPRHILHAWTQGVRISDDSIYRKYWYIVFNIDISYRPKKYRIWTSGMLNSFFSKFEFRRLKFRLNSNFIYIFVEKLKQFAFDVCSVSGPPRFVTLIACISIQHAPGARSAKRRVIEPRGSMQGGEGRGGVSKHVASIAWIVGGREQRNRHTVHRWSNSAPLSRQNRLRLTSDAWIRTSKVWKTNTNLNLKFEVRKSELRLTLLNIDF